MLTNAIETRTVRSEASGKLKRAGLWALQILLAANFLFAGGAKLAGMEPMGDAVPPLVLLVLLSLVAFGRRSEAATRGTVLGGAQAG